MPGEEHELMARALEAAARTQEEGALLRIGELYDTTVSRILEMNPDYDDSIAFAFTFWDNWADAANHDWQYHDPIRERHWPDFAHEVASSVRRAELPDNLFLVEHIRLKPRRSFWQWLKSLCGHVA